MTIAWISFSIPFGGVAACCAPLYSSAEDLGNDRALGRSISLPHPLGVGRRVWRAWVCQWLVSWAKRSGPWTDALAWPNRPFVKAVLQAGAASGEPTGAADAACGACPRPPVEAGPTTQ